MTFSLKTERGGRETSVLVMYSCVTIIPQLSGFENVFFWCLILWVDWALLGSSHVGAHGMGWAGVT